MTAVIKRARSFEVFDRRYAPIDGPDGDMVRSWDDREIVAAFDGGEESKRLVWTLVEGDTGRLYLVPGFATVNYLGRVLCSRPWPDAELMAAGYKY